MSKKDKSINNTPAKKDQPADSLGKNTKQPVASASSSYDLLKLDQQLCFSLYVCSKEIIKKYKPLLDPHGLTYTGYIILLALWEADNINVKELGKRLYLDSGTLTPMLKKLESQDYIKRTRSLNDERNVYIELTEKGKSLKKEAIHIPESMICNLDLEAQYASGLLQGLHQMMRILDSENCPME
jgi:MarR family transcriptional regulator, organic hydroperoxide resistance regulator